MDQYPCGHVRFIGTQEKIISIGYGFVLFGALNHRGSIYNFDGGSSFYKVWGDDIDITYLSFGSYKVSSSYDMVAWVFHGYVF